MQSEAAEFELTRPRDAKTNDLTRSQDAEIDLTQHQAGQGFANFSALGRKLRYEKEKTTRFEGPFADK